MERYEPDYQRVVDAARNRMTDYLPLYEHMFSEKVMGMLLDCDMAALLAGSFSEKKEYFSKLAGFLTDNGYDVIPYEYCLTAVFPDGGALGGHKEGAIHTMADFARYPWESLCDRYFEAADPYFTALRAALPPGMKVIGGVGNGVFESVQDLTGYMNLCYIREDDPALFAGLFEKIGALLDQIWARFLRDYGDIMAVCRFGDFGRDGYN